MVTDVVNDRQPLVLVFSQTATELLQPDDLRLGGPQHHPSVDGMEVDSRVEHVDGEDHLKVSGGQTLQRGRARIGRWSGMHCRAGYALFREAAPHEVGMTLRDAEGEGALATALAPLLQNILGSALSGDRLGQRFFVKARATPRYVCVIDVVGHAEVLIGAKQPLLDSS